MNTYKKYVPNVYLAKCDEPHKKGEVIKVTTKYGKENEHYVHNLISQRDGFWYYSITRVDGYNCQERARAKADKYEAAAHRADQRADEYFDKSNKDADFLSLGEPIKVGHHSEKRHRKAIEDAWRNTGKMVEEMDKRDAYKEKADAWNSHVDDINLSMPESIEYFKELAAKTAEYHKQMKEGKVERSHAYSLTYAKKAANEAQHNYELAVKLWGDNQ